MTIQDAVSIHNILCNPEGNVMSQLGLFMMSRGGSNWLDVSGDDADEAEAIIKLNDRKATAAIYRELADALDPQGT